jgi:hypothetical protein
MKGYFRIIAVIEEPFKKQSGCKQLRMTTPERGLGSPRAEELL